LPCPPPPALQVLDVHVAHVHRHHYRHGRPFAKPENPKAIRLMLEARRHTGSMWPKIQADVEQGFLREPTSEYLPTDRDT
jgi:hypothetical protein